MFDSVERIKRSMGQAPTIWDSLFHYLRVFVVFVVSVMVFILFVD